MNWWRQRSVREKLGMMAVSALLSAVALFLLLEPLVDERRRLYEELPRLREDLAWMEANLSKAGKPDAPHANDEQPVSPARVEALLQEAGIRQLASEMQPLADRGLRVSFNEVNFPDLLVFISRLQDEGYARVTGMRVNGLEGYNGLVTAELKLLPR